MNFASGFQQAASTNKLGKLGSPNRGKKPIQGWKDLGHLSVEAVAARISPPIVRNLPAEQTKSTPSPQIAKHSTLSNRGLSNLAEAPKKEIANPFLTRVKPNPNIPTFQFIKKPEKRVHQRIEEFSVNDYMKLRCPELSDFDLQPVQELLQLLSPEDNGSSLEKLARFVLRRHLVLAKSLSPSKVYRPYYIDETPMSDTVQDIRFWLQEYFRRKNPDDPEFSGALDGEIVELGSHNQKAFKYNCLLLFGKCGAGKTTAVEAICHSDSYSLERVDCAMFKNFWEIKKQYAEAVQTLAVRSNVDGEGQAKQPAAPKVSDFFKKAANLPEEDEIETEDDKTRKARGKAERRKVFLLENYELLISEALESPEEGAADKLIFMMTDFFRNSKYPWIIETDRQGRDLLSEWQSKDIDKLYLKVVSARNICPLFMLIRVIERLELILSKLTKQDLANMSDPQGMEASFPVSQNQPRSRGTENCIANQAVDEFEDPFMMKWAQMDAEELDAADEPAKVNILNPKQSQESGDSDDLDSESEEREIVSQQNLPSPMPSLYQLIANQNEEEKVQKVIADNQLPTIKRYRHKQTVAHKNYITYFEDSYNSFKSRISILLSFQSPDPSYPNLLSYIVLSKVSPATDLVHLTGYFKASLSNFHSATNLLAPETFHSSQFTGADPERNLLPALPLHLSYWGVTEFEVPPPPARRPEPAQIAVSEPYYDPLNPDSSAGIMYDFPTEHQVPDPVLPACLEQPGTGSNQWSNGTYGNNSQCTLNPLNNRQEWSCTGWASDFLAGGPNQRTAIVEPFDCVLTPTGTDAGLPFEIQNGVRGAALGIPGLENPPDSTVVKTQDGWGDRIGESELKNSEEHQLTQREAIHYEDAPLTQTDQTDGPFSAPAGRVYPDYRGLLAVWYKLRRLCRFKQGLACVGIFAETQPRDLVYKYLEDVCRTYQAQKSMFDRWDDPLMGLGSNLDSKWCYPIREMRNAEYVGVVNSFLFDSLKQKCNLKFEPELLETLVGLHEEGNLFKVFDGDKQLKSAFEARIEIFKLRNDSEYAAVASHKRKMRKGGEGKVLSIPKPQIVATTQAETNPDHEGKSSKPWENQGYQKFNTNQMFKNQGSDSRGKWGKGFHQYQKRGAGSNSNGGGINYSSGNSTYRGQYSKGANKFNPQSNYASANFNNHFGKLTERPSQSIQQSFAMQRAVESSQYSVDSSRNSFSMRDYSRATNQEGIASPYTDWKSPIDSDELLQEIELLTRSAQEFPTGYASPNSGHSVAAIDPLFGSAQSSLQMADPTRDSVLRHLRDSPDPLSSPAALVSQTTPGNTAGRNSEYLVHSSYMDILDECLPSPDPTDQTDHIDQEMNQMDHNDQTDPIDDIESSHSPPN